MSTDADHTFNTLRKWPVEVVRAKMEAFEWDRNDLSNPQDKFNAFLAQYGWTWDEFMSACEQSKENPTQCN